MDFLTTGRKQRAVRAIVTIFLGTAVAAVSFAAATPASARTNAAARPVASLMKHASPDGEVRLIVGVNAPFQPIGALSDEEAAVQQRAIAAAQSSLLGELRGTSHRVLRRYNHIPFIAIEAGQDAVAVLSRSAAVTDLQADVPDRPALIESTEIVQATQTASHNLTGTGRTVAVLDTGVESSHVFFSGKVVEEACFSDGDCYNGQDFAWGSGAAAPCTYNPSDCSHGTHVAGIAVGNRVGLSGGGHISGVAPGANVMPIQVFSDVDGEAKSFPSDQIAALERVLERRALHKFAAVNMSIGGGTSTTVCDSTQQARKTAIDNLLSVGIPTIISAGNDGKSDALTVPACISSAISVGNTRKNDTVYSSSNSAAFLDLLAPGTGIWSSVPGNALGQKTGTSMAAPHVAGAWAVLKSVAPDHTVQAILTALQNTGTMITDSRNKISRARINVLDALEQIGTIGVFDAKANEGDGYIRFSVRLAKTYDHIVSVRVRTIDGTARAGSDFEYRSVLIRFHPGTKSASVAVPLIDDTAREYSEQMGVVISVDGANVYDSQAFGTIGDNDWSSRYNTSYSSGGTYAQG